MLTQEDKLFIIRLTKKGRTPFFNAMFRDWMEDGVKMGHYYVDVYASAGTYSKTLYKGKYDDCKKWVKEAYEFHDEVSKILAEKELAGYRQSGIDI